MKWISVKDKLPMDEEIVLIGRKKTKAVGIAQYFSNMNRFYAFDKDMKPTHWMKLPKPLKSIRRKQNEKT